MVGFFTRLPVPKIEYSEESYSRAVKFIPLVGLVIGAILVLAELLLLALNAPALICGAILLTIYIFLTGGLHFDGLADTCDGVFSGRTREQALEIMKDSRLGVFGALGIFTVGLFYFVLVHIPRLPGKIWPVTFAENGQIMPAPQQKQDRADKLHGRQKFLRKNLLDLSLQDRDE